MPSLFDRMVAGMMPAVPRSIAWRVSRRYIAGVEVDDAMSLARELAGQGLSTTVDILGEYKESPAVMDAVKADYLELIDRQAAAGVDRNVSIKLSQIGLQTDRDACLARMREICARSAASGGKLRIDMEDSRCTSDTLWVYRRLRGEFERVGVVLQAYMRRSARDVAELAELVPDYRLCKGIYVEAPEVAIQDPAEINRNYLALLATMLDGGSFVGIATHDRALVDGALRLLAERGLGTDRYEFQMLLGVREGLRGELAAAGHPLRVYVPFGRDWYAYSMRRLKENPSIAGHVFRNMLRLG